MLIVDASALFEVVADTPRAEAIRIRMASDPEHAAPHLVRAEVLSVIQSGPFRGEPDRSVLFQHAAQEIE